METNIQFVLSETLDKRLHQRCRRCFVYLGSCILI